MGSYVPLPIVIYAKKAIINSRNVDVYSFKWCVLAAVASKFDKSIAEELRRLAHRN